MKLGTLSDERGDCWEEYFERRVFWKPVSILWKPWRVFWKPRRVLWKPGRVLWNPERVLRRPHLEIIGQEEPLIAQIVKDVPGYLCFMLQRHSSKESLPGGIVSKARTRAMGNWARELIHSFATIPPRRLPFLHQGQRGKWQFFAPEEGSVPVDENPSFWVGHRTAAIGWWLKTFQSWFKVLIS